MSVISVMEESALSERRDTDNGRPMRVKEAAALLDVHVATIYREIEAGRLYALRVGEGRGTLRIPRRAWNEYVASVGTAPAVDAA